jgi:hypothetical protein
LTTQKQKEVTVTKGENPEGKAFIEYKEKGKRTRYVLQSSRKNDPDYGTWYVFKITTNAITLFEGRKDACIDFVERWLGLKKGV